MMTSLLKPDDSYDRAAIMAKAHRETRAARRRGEAADFASWLAYAWRVARDQRALRVRLARQQGGTPARAAIACGAGMRAAA